MDSVYRLILCVKCNEVCFEPSETLCCGVLYCSSCSKSNNFFCEECKKLTKLRRSIAMQRIINSIPIECRYCGQAMESSILEGHLNECDLKQIICKYCQVPIVKKDLLGHLAQNHEDVVLDTILNPCANQKEIFGPQKNSSGRVAKIGSNGKYYCGAKLDIPCKCCDGFCGPTNGCNCTACLMLDIEIRNLQGPFYVNRDGAICKVTALGFYCGRKILDGVLGCDGHCGPTNGPNCSACNNFQSKYRFIQPKIEKLKKK